MAKITGSNNKLGDTFKSLMYNRWVLYFIFTLSFGNIIYLGSSGDFTNITIFALIGFLTTFFSKNMVAILSIALVFSSIIKYGINLKANEGFTFTTKDKTKIKSALNQLLGDDEEEGFKEEEEEGEEGFTLYEGATSLSSLEAAKTKADKAAATAKTAMDKAAANKAAADRAVADAAKAVKNAKNKNAKQSADNTLKNKNQAAASANNNYNKAKTNYNNAKSAADKAKAALDAAIPEALIKTSEKLKNDFVEVKKNKTDPVTILMK